MSATTRVTGERDASADNGGSDRGRQPAFIRRDGSPGNGRTVRAHDRPTQRPNGGMKYELDATTTRD